MLNEELLCCKKEDFVLLFVNVYVEIQYIYCSASLTTHQHWTSRAPWHSMARVETQEDYRLCLELSQ